MAVGALKSLNDEAAIIHIWGQCSRFFSWSLALATGCVDTEPLEVQLINASRPHQICLDAVFEHFIICCWHPHRAKLPDLQIHQRPTRSLSTTHVGSGTT